MVMHGRNLKTCGAQFFHYRVQLVLKDDQIAHDHCIFVGAGECGPRAESQSRLDREPVNGNMQVGSRKSDLIYIADLLAGPAQRLIDIRGIEALS
jgi:hypothetical protein